MLEQLIAWFKQRRSSERFPADDALPPIVPSRRKDDQHPHDLRQTSDLRKTRAHVRKGETLTPTVEQATESSYGRNGDTKIESLGPGKNVLIRNKYVREETGTHETLKILDDDSIDSGEVSGIDPYNTGGFDRSKNWDNRFRK